MNVSTVPVHPHLKSTSPLLDYLVILSQLFSAQVLFFCSSLAKRLVSPSVSLAGQIAYLALGYSFVAFLLRSAQRHGSESLSSTGHEDLPNPL